MADEAPKPGYKEIYSELPAETKLPQHLWKNMPEDLHLCTTCYIFGKSRPAWGNMCPSCNINAICVTCEKKKRVPHLPREPGWVRRSKRPTLRQ
jgi:hypothetical protein